MSDDVSRRLADMRFYAQVAQRMIAGRSYDDFLRDERMRYATQYLLLVVGEASLYVPESVKLRLAAIPWAKLRGMRNRLAHAYATVEPPIVYLVATEEIPHLLRVLAAGSARRA
jgi:uncharacterized protein with HEPN domain